MKKSIPSNSPALQLPSDYKSELGVGFAYIGNQVHLSVGKNDYFLDLLFYHVKLRCYIVIEIKAGPFKPEFAGKSNFYLSAVDDTFRHPDDKPSIGLLLCRSKGKVDVEYALRDINKPIGIANWETKIVKSLPKEFKGSLPTVKELEKEFIIKKTNQKVRREIRHLPGNRPPTRPAWRSGTKL